MPNATRASGHGTAVTATIAASSTATFPATSFRVQIQTDRPGGSSGDARKRHRDRECLASGGYGTRAARHVSAPVNPGMSREDRHEVRKRKGSIAVR
jgi:hypothetical protein